LEHLLRQPGVQQVEIDVNALLSDTQRLDTIARTAREVDTGLRDGQDMVLFTSRQLVTGADAISSLSLRQRVSEGVVAIVQVLSVWPRYILAKGGITSSDVATQGLGVRRALVLGQILPGVPVWQLGPETRHPGLGYIVFPGNVGGPQALAEVVLGLRSQAERAH